MISKTIGYNGVHNIFRQTHMGITMDCRGKKNHTIIHQYGSTNMVLLPIFSL